MDASLRTAVLPDSCLSDPAGPDRMSPHVPPDEVHPSVQRNAEAVHLHAHGGQLVSPRFFGFLQSDGANVCPAAASPVSPLCRQRAARQ